MLAEAGHKPGSVSPLQSEGVMTIHLVPMLPPGSSDRPGSSGGPPLALPYLVLLRAGFA